MKSVEQIVAYKTSDGATFDNVKDAAAHQRRVNFYEWFVGSEPLYGGDGRVRVTDMLEWLQNNRAVVLALLGDAR